MERFGSPLVRQCSERLRPLASLGVTWSSCDSRMPIGVLGLLKMIVTAWNNGSHHESGAGYGVRVRGLDRDRFVNREWGRLTLQLEGVPSPIAININKPSFWGDQCRELISREIGRWLISQGLAPWPQGRPPKLELIPLTDNCFYLKRIG